MLFNNNKKIIIKYTIISKKYIKIKNREVFSPSFKIMFCGDTRFWKNSDVMSIQCLVIRSLNIYWPKAIKILVMSFAENGCNHGSYKSIIANTSKLQKEWRIWVMFNCQYSFGDRFLRVEYHALTLGNCVHRLCLRYSHV